MNKKGGSVGGRQLLAFTLLRPTHLKMLLQIIKKAIVHTLHFRGRACRKGLEWLIRWKGKIVHTLHFRGRACRN